METLLIILAVLAIAAAVLIGWAKGNIFAAVFLTLPTVLIFGGSALVNDTGVTGRCLLIGAVLVCLIWAPIWVPHAMRDRQRVAALRARDAEQERERHAAAWRNYDEAVSFTG
jgi:hypothetical protein